MIKAIIFDLDGTLLDTLEDLADSVNAVLESYGCPQRTIEEIRMFVGNGIRNLMKLAVEGGEDHPQFESIFNAFKKYYAKNSRNKTKPYEGIMMMLHSLQKMGMKMAIVSNKADFAVKELNTYYFKEYMTTAIGEREGIRRKPAPDTVFEAMKELHVTADEVVFVGDSEVDADTAQNAGLPCIGVLWGFRDEQILKEHGVKHFAKTPMDIVKIVETGI